MPTQRVYCRADFNANRQLPTVRTARNVLQACRVLAHLGERLLVHRLLACEAWLRKQPSQGLQRLQGSNTAWEEAEEKHISNMPSNSCSRKQSMIVYSGAYSIVAMKLRDER